MSSLRLDESKLPCEIKEEETNILFKVVQKLVLIARFRTLKEIQGTNDIIEELSCMIPK